MAVVGAALLVAAGSPRREEPAREGRSTHEGWHATTSTCTTDVDYTDPALDYFEPGWELEYATACKLFNYPDKEGAEGLQLVPEAAAGLPTISNNGKTYISRSGRFKFSTGQAVTAAELRRRVQPRRRPEDAVAAVARSWTSSPAPGRVDDKSPRLGCEGEPATT